MYFSERNLDKCQTHRRHFPLADHPADISHQVIPAVLALRIQRVALGRAILKHTFIKLLGHWTAWGIQVGHGITIENLGSCKHHWITEHHTETPSKFRTAKAAASRRFVLGHCSSWIRIYMQDRQLSRSQFLGKLESTVHICFKSCFLEKGPIVVRSKVLATLHAFHRSQRVAVPWLRSKLAWAAWMVGVSANPCRGKWPTKALVAVVPIDATRCHKLAHVDIHRYP